jgi:transposase
MNKGIRYTDSFKQEAVNQIVKHGYPVSEVSDRLGVSTKSLYDWIKKYKRPAPVREELGDLQAEVARLKRELKRTEQERDILKEATVFFAGESKNATRS